MSSSNSEHVAVTVIAVCFNHARYLIDCLDSIRDQIFQDFQLIVTDDASTDNSAELIAAWIVKNRPNALFIRHDKNRGLCATLNEAVAAAKGEWISMVATDDRWLPQKIAYQLDCAVKISESTAVIYSDAEMIDEGGRCSGQSFISAHRQLGSMPQGQIFSELADGNFIPAMSTLIRASSLRTVGGYDESLVYEDYDMWLRLSGAGFHFLYCPAVLAHYRVVSTSMSNTLFIRPSAQLSDTVIKLHERWLATDRLTKNQRRRFGRKLADAAYNLFLHDDPRAKSYLWLASWRTRSIRMIILAVASNLGVTRQRGKHLLSKLGLPTR